MKGAFKIMKNKIRFCLQLLFYYILGYLIFNVFLFITKYLLFIYLNWKITFNELIIDNLKISYSIYTIWFILFNIYNLYIVKKLNKKLKKIRRDK